MLLGFDSSWKLTKNERPVYYAACKCESIETLKSCELTHSWRCEKSKKIIIMYSEVCIKNAAFSRETFLVRGEDIPSYTIRNTVGVLL